MAVTSEDVYLTVEEVAQRYRTTPATVHGWVHQGKASRSIRVGKRRLFALSDLIAWESAHADQPEPVAAP